MANSPRDVALTVSVETVGTEGVKNLRDKLQELAKEGGSAAPEFKKLADEIQRLGEQSQVASSIRNLSSEIEALSQSEAEAAAAAKLLGDQFDQVSQVTDNFRNKEEALKLELQTAQRALFDKTQGLKKLKNDTDAASRSSDGFKDSVKKQNGEMIEAQTKIRNLADSYNAAKQATKEAAANEKEHADGLKYSTGEASKLKGQLDAKNQSLREAKTQLEALGAVSKNVADAESELLEKYSDLSVAIDKSTQAQVAAKVEAVKAAAEAKAAIEARIAAETEYANKVGVINAQIAIARKAEIAKVQAAEKAANDERVAAEKSISDRLVSETKKANEERIIAEKAYRDACEEEAKRYANKLDIINQQIANAQKVANQKVAADAKQLADERIAAELRVEAAAKQVSDALGNVGVRSAANIRVEIQRVKDSLETLKSTGTLTGVELDSAFKQGGRQIKELERELRGVTNELTLADRGANLFKTSMGQFAAGNIIANGVMIVVEKLGELGRAFITTMIQGEQLSKAMNVIYGDSKLAASQIDFLRKTSIQTGISFSEVTTEFVKFSASMKSANIPLEQSNALFRAVTSASSALGLGTEATAGALNALAQMASKGVVSMEELRQQLGDRLPGVMGLTAKAMGITEGELVKLVESGKLATRDFIVPFTKGMETLKGEADGVMPTLNKFKSALATVAQDIGAAGGLQVLKGAVEVLGGALTGVSVILSAFTETLFGVGKAAGVLLGALWTLTNPMEALKEILDESSDRFTKQQRILKLLSGGYDEAAEAAKAKGAALVAIAEQTKKAEQIVSGYAQSQNLSKVATDLMSDATLTAAGNIAKFTNEAEKLLESQEQQTTASKRLVEARKSEGKELITLANLSGDSTQIRNAEAQAIELEANALDDLIASQKAEVDLLVVQRKQIEADAAARNLSKDAIKSQIGEIDKKLIPAQAELEETRKATDAVNAEVTARKLVAEALRDNSVNLDEYGKSLKAAKANVAEIIEQEKAGILTKQDVKVAQEALSRATYLYNDALKDSIAKVELETKAKGAALQVASARASVGQSHYESLAKEARALGDTAMATYYDIEAKKQAIKVLQLKMELERLQNAAALIEIDLKRKQIDATTDEGRAKLQVLDIEKQMIQIKNINNEAIQSQIRSIDAEITALRIGNTVKDSSAAANNKDTGARVSNVGAIDAQTSALMRQGAASAAAAAAAKKASQEQSTDYQYRAKGGAVDNLGSFMMRDKLRAGTLTEADIPFMETVAKNQRATIESFRQMSLPRSLEGVKDDQEWLGVAFELEAKVKEFKAKRAIAEAKQSLGITSSDETDKKAAAARLLMDNKYTLSAAEQEQLNKIPKFASGGYHKGGVRLVGENGPELEVTGPSHIIDADNTKELLRKNLEKQNAAKISINSDKKSIDWSVKDLTASAERLNQLQTAKDANSPTGFEKINEEMAMSRKIDNHRSSLLSSLNRSNWQLNLLQKEQKELEASIASAPVKKPSNAKPVLSVDDHNRLERERVDAHVRGQMTTPASTPAANQLQTTGNKSYTVNINLNGATTSVNTATDNDATALLGVLKSLQMRAS